MVLCMPSKETVHKSTQVPKVVKDDKCQFAERGKVREGPSVQSYLHHPKLLQLALADLEMDPRRRTVQKPIASHVKIKKTSSGSPFILLRVSIIPLSQSKHQSVIKLGSG